MPDTIHVAGNQPGVERLRVGVDFLIRPSRPGDSHLIADSWRRSYEDSEFARTPSLDVYIRSQRAAVLMALEGGEAVVAHDPEDDDHLLGWLCFRRPDVLHYIFVKDFSRGKGIGRALFQHVFPPGTERVYATHVRTWALPTKLSARVRHEGSGGSGRRQQVWAPTWKLFGVWVNFNPFLLLIER